MNNLILYFNMTHGVLLRIFQALQSIELPQFRRQLNLPETNVYVMCGHFMVVILLRTHYSIICHKGTLM